MALSHSPSIVTDGLVLCLDAANRKSYPGSGITWNNIVSFQNNVTLVNSPTFNLDKGGKIIFDGIDDYGQSSINLLSSSMSIEMTFRITSFDLPWVDLLVLDDGTNEIWFELGGSNGEPNTNGYLRYYSSYTGGVGSQSGALASSEQYIVDSKIHTSVLTVGSSLATSYFDGKFQGSGNVTENKTFNRIVLANDLIRTGYPRIAKCEIYQVKVYNRMLFKEEISQNFNALRGRFGI